MLNKIDRYLLYLKHIENHQGASFSGSKFKRKKRGFRLLTSYGRTVV